MLAPQTSEKNRSRNFFRERLPDSGSGALVISHKRVKICNRSRNGWFVRERIQWASWELKIPRTISPGPVREQLQKRLALRDSASGIPRAQIFTGLCVFAALVKGKIPRAAIGLPGRNSAEQADFSFRSRTQIPRATKFSLICRAHMASEQI